jgi:hypothetical protein
MREEFPRADGHGRVRGVALFPGFQGPRRETGPENLRVVLPGQFHQFDQILIPGPEHLVQGFAHPRFSRNPQGLLRGEDRKSVV